MSGVRLAGSAASGRDSVNTDLAPPGWALVREAELRRAAYNVHIACHLRNFVVFGWDECPSCGETRAEVFETWTRLRRERGSLGVLQVTGTLS